MQRRWFVTIMLVTMAGLRVFPGKQRRRRKLDPAPPPPPPPPLPNPIK